MKPVYTAIFLLIISTLNALAQIAPSSERSYVVEQTPRTPQTNLALNTPTADVPATVSYFDGLGRLLQTVQVRGSGDATTDIIGGTTTYDGFGRIQKTYLPVPSPAGLAVGQVQGPAAIQTAGATFYGDANPFAETEYEASPLNRPEKQWGAGAAWRTAVRPTQFGYGTAEANTVVRFTANVGSGILHAHVAGGTARSYYGPNDISTRTVNDEEGNQTIEYTDIQGRTVRRETSNGAQILITAYVYDEQERLAAVVPPKLYDWFMAQPTGTELSFEINGQANATFKEGAYAYCYDGRGRLIRKHVPGAGWTDLVYDQQDRPVMSRDEQDRAEGNWRYTRYDGLSRVVETGRLTLSRSPEDLRADFADSEVTGEAFPSTVNPPAAAILTQLYYDTYDGAAFAYEPTNAYDPPFGYDAATNSIEEGRAYGLLTRSRVRNLSTGTWYETVRWYDDRGRVVQQQGQTVRGNDERTDWQYSFNGEVTQQRTEREGLTELTTYTYDHLGRKTSTTHQLNGGAAQPLAYYTYDGIGRLAGKELGGTGSGNPGNGPLTIPPDQTTTLPDYATWTHSQLLLGGTLRFGTGSVLRLADTGGGGALQTLAYRWHIRGGLRGINTDNNGNLLTDRLFAIKLDYETQAGYYNGNIRKQTWRSSHDGQERTYTYAYDPLSRLTGATGSEGVTTLSSIDYDVNGNIQTMQREGVDNLSYTYQDDSNKLLSVSDSQAGTLGFVDGNTSGNDYEYWPDGSLKKDRNKQITRIEYYHTKQPKRIVFQSGQEVQYEYDAAGTKLKKTVSNGGTTTTEYVGNQVWENGALYQIAHEEGRIVPGATAGTYRYEWSLQDHLGNNRVSFSNNGSGGAQVVQSQHFDPWGWELPGLGTSQSQTNRYKMTGKEWQTETGLTDLGWRLYDATTTRLNTIDGAAELAANTSTYAYVGNNPVSYIDAEGGFRIDAYFAQRYPTLAKIIGHYLPMVKDNPAVTQALMKQFGYSDAAKFASDFTYGQGPWITPTRPEVRGLDANGPLYDFSSSAGWRYDSKYNENLFISADALRKLEATYQNKDVQNLGAVMFEVTGKILHEYAHYLNFKTNGFTEAMRQESGNEQGALFEFNAFGQRFSYKSFGNPGWDYNASGVYYQANRSSTSMIGMSLSPRTYFNNLFMFSPVSGTSGDPAAPAKSSGKKRTPLTYEPSER
jgi:RHS repeat-associated protein